VVAVVDADEIVTAEATSQAAQEAVTVIAIANFLAKKLAVVDPIALVKSGLMKGLRAQSDHEAKSRGRTNPKPMDRVLQHKARIVIERRDDINPKAFAVTDLLEMKNPVRHRLEQVIAHDRRTIRLDRRVRLDMAEEEMRQHRLLRLRAWAKKSVASLRSFLHQTHNFE
jgi:hypothetical protein